MNWKSKLALAAVSASIGTTVSAQDVRSKEIVRIAEIEVHPKHVQEFTRLARVVAEESLSKEPGVLCLYPVQVRGSKTSFRVIEVYRDQAAYEAHLQAPHFLRYKAASLPMVSSLKLVDTDPIVAELLPTILKKHEQGAVSALERVVTLEEHFVIPAINKQVSDYFIAQNGGKPIVTEAQRELMSIVLPDTDIAELGARRLSFMDEAGVTMQVLSYGAEGPQNLPDKALALRLCQAANDSLARIIELNPKRFSGFALLPMVDPLAAAQELERSVRQLGLRGAMISGSPFGKHLDEQEFRPIFAKAAELGVLIYLHPGAVPATVSNYYAPGQGWSDVAAAMFATAGYLWHADSGMEVLRLIMSGLFEEYPSLQIISGHWGELVPFYFNRLDDQQSKVLKLPRKISDYYRTNVYLTPSGFFSEAQLRYALDVVGADRILYSADYPFLKDKTTRSFLEQASIPDAAKKRIAYENADRLLKLGR